MEPQSKTTNIGTLTELAGPVLQGVLLGRGRHGPGNVSAVREIGEEDGLESFAEALLEFFEIT